MADKSDAWLDGWFAHKRGENNSDENNPYDEHKQARSHHAWLAGWCDRFSRAKRAGCYEDEIQFPHDNSLFED